MPNKNYLKGVRKERKIIQDLKAMGFEIAQRSAGSHSPIDIFAICRARHLIKFIQSKPDSYSKSATDKIYEELDWLNGHVWQVIFQVI